jgi:hypothetical protein
VGKANRNPLVAAQDQQNVIPQCQIQGPQPASQTAASEMVITTGI